jgi:hypothetical protein
MPVVLSLMLASVSTAGEPLPKVELSKRGKEATALLELKPRTAYAAAVCVHPSGLFVTTEQPLKQRGSAETVTLVLQPGLKTQKVVQAKVVRSDTELNLALLRVEGVDRVPALSLSSEDLTELEEIAAFGFPFGSDLGEGEYPALSVKLGHVSSLRRKGGDLVRAQLDASLVAGFSGGPVLDAQGRTAGIVMTGGTPESTYVIPANVVARFLARPDVRFTPPMVTRANRGQPHLFEVRAVSVLPSNQPLEVELILRGEDGKDRRHRLEPKDGVYRVKAVPALEHKGPVRLQTSITFADGAVTGLVADQAFSAAETSLRLSAVQSIRFGPKAQVTLLDGKVLEGPLASLETLDVRIDEAPVAIRLAEATEARFEVPAAGSAVAYTLVVTREGKEVARLNGQLGGDSVLSGQPIAASGTGIRPPVLDKDRVVKMLPGAVTDVCVGGAGRFLILHLAQQRKLAVFDLNKAQIVHYISVAEDKVKFAAGKDKLLIMYPDKHLIQRWSLTTFKREVTVPLEMKVPAVALAMGSASDGPLAISGVDWPRLGETVFFDVRTMKRIEQGYQPHGAFDTSPSVFLRAAANGKVFACQMSAGAGMQSCIVSSSNFKLCRGGGGNFPVPSPDGRVICTTNGLFSGESKQLKGGNTHYLPALHGPYYLSVLPGSRPDQQKTSLGVHIIGGSQRLVTLNDIVEARELSLGQPGDLTLDKRIYLVPDAKLLVLLPSSNNRLLLHRFDVEEALEKSDIDYLVVLSQPPTTFQKGSSYDYQMVVKSKKGGVKYKLESGPSGMTITPSGLLHWVAPGNGNESEVDVIVTVSDATGQEVFHTFKISPQEKK